MSNAELIAKWREQADRWGGVHAEMLRQCAADLAAERGEAAEMYPGIPGTKRILICECPKCEEPIYGLVQVESEAPPTPDLSDLEAKARAATAIDYPDAEYVAVRTLNQLGGFTEEVWDVEVHSGNGDAIRLVCDCGATKHDSNRIKAEFITAANPQTILTLIARLRAASSV